MLLQLQHPNPSPFHMASTPTQVAPPRTPAELFMNDEALGEYNPPHPPSHPPPPSPTLTTPINYNDEHGNEASVHKFVYTNSISHEPLMNNASVHPRPPPWPDQQQEHPPAVHETYPHSRLPPRPNQPLQYHTHPLAAHITHHHPPLGLTNAVLPSSLTFTLATSH